MAKIHRVSDCDSSCSVATNNPERMLSTVPLELFLYISKLVQLQNPILLMTEEESIQAEFCLDASFPLSCRVSGSGETLDHLESNQVEDLPTSILLSQGSHKTWIEELSTYKHLFGETYTWVVPADYEVLLPLRLDSRVVLYNATGADGYNIYESYAVNGGDPITTKIMEWMPGVKKNEDVKVLDNILEKRSNLNGVTIRYSWFHNPPFVRFNRDGSGKVVGYSGFYVDLFNELQHQLQFTAEYVPPKPKEKWGAKTKNGSWNGMVGMLIRDEIDYSAIGCGINAQRKSVVDFGFPTRGNLFTLMIASTDKPKLNVWAYVNIFPLTAWVIILAFILLVTLYFSFSNRQV